MLYRMGLREYEHELTEAVQRLEQAQADLQDAKERVERENRRVRALKQVVKGLRELEPADPPQVEQLPFGMRTLTPEEIEELTAPRGRDAVRQVMKGSERDWKPAQVVAAVMDNGWVEADAKAPEASIRVALRRLVDDGEVQKLDTGLYRYRDSGATVPEQADPAAAGLEATTAEGVG
jgi:hypothetical protein